MRYLWVGTITACATSAAVQRSESAPRQADAVISEPPAQPGIAAGRWARKIVRFLMRLLQRARGS